MTYLLLVHHDEESFGKIPEGMRKQMLSESVQLTHHLHASGQYLHASPLLPASAAVLVRVRGGRTEVIDGPFAETKEQLTGYFLVRAGDLNEAVRIAGQVPGARIGTVEVRPVRDIDGLPAE